MDIKTIAPDLSVSPQITAQDVGIAASQGFRSLIINRPDGEAGDQTDHAVIEEAARRHGLDVRYVPVVAGKVTDADVEAFDKAMHELPKVRRKICCKESFVKLHMASECIRVLTAAMRSKALSIEQKAADRCVAALYKAHEGCGWVGFNPPSLPEVCLGIMKGHVKPGQSCRSALECVKGLSCFGLSSTSPGVCLPPRKRGQNCGSVVDPLAVLTRQNNVDKQRPRCRGYCVRGVCETVTQVGKKCYTDRQCGPGMHCADTKCQKGTFPKLGQPCSYKCEKGARCVKRKCVRIKKIGEPCTNEDECRAGCLIPKGKKVGVCGVQCASIRGQR